MLLLSEGGASENWLLFNKVMPFLPFPPSTISVPLTSPLLFPIFYSSVSCTSFFFRLSFKGFSLPIDFVEWNLVTFCRART